MPVDHGVFGEALGTGRPQVLRWLLAIGAMFVAWRVWRGLKPFLWALFGLYALRHVLGG